MSLDGKAKSFQIHLSLGLIAIGCTLACGTEDEGAISGIDHQTAALQSMEEAQVAVDVDDIVAPLSEANAAPRDALSVAGSGYGRRSRCAQVSVNRGLLTVDFGNGCTYQGRLVEGSLTVTATRTEPDWSFEVSLQNLSVDQVARNGVIRVEGDGTRQLMVDYDLVTTSPDGQLARLFSGSLALASQVLTVDGTGSVSGTSNRSVDIATVEWEAGDCAPRAGVITLDQAEMPTVRVTFSAQTPVTGEVQVQYGRLPPQTATLPQCS